MGNTESDGVEILVLLWLFSNPIHISALLSLTPSQPVGHQFAHSSTSSNHVTWSLKNIQIYPDTFLGPDPRSFGMRTPLQLAWCSIAGFDAT